MAKVWSRNTYASTAQINRVNLSIDTLVIQRSSYVKYGHIEPVWLENGDNGTSLTTDGIHYNAAGNTELDHQWRTILDQNSLFGTLTVIPNILPASGGSVKFSWTSRNAISANVTWTSQHAVSSLDIENSSIESGTQETGIIYPPILFVLTLNGQNNEKVIYSVTVSVEGQSASSLPQNYFFKPLFPNPSNGDAIIEYEMPNDGYVSLIVFDSLGREISILAQGMYSRGVHRFSWNIGDLASGVYYCKFTSGSYTKTQKMVVIR